MNMLDKISISKEETKLLQERNALLESQLADCGKVQTSCSENLDSMRSNLNALQDLVVKCRAVLSIHAGQTSGHPTPPISPAAVPSSPSKVVNFHPLENAFAAATSSPPPPISSHAALKSEIGLLKAQLDIYKSDFAEERMARLSLLAENNRLVSQVQQLQQQNRTLIADALNGHEEQLTYSRRCSRMSQESDGTVMASTAPAPDDQSIKDGPGANYQGERKASQCQHCNGVFSDIYSLETHIDECPAY
ncbi:NF-kappa-B essential modulator-like [Armigeres subalbatus]|uniref:NF-kappa-B essential modulator-like n=1 Tax=Armigeres subalbatus TaxID=124917 RepID=UPI002ED1F70F